MRRPYRSLGPFREGRLPGAAGIVLACLLASLAGGCGMSFPIASLVADDTPTGSIGAKTTSPLSAELGPEDWRRAKGALAIALDPQGNGSAVAWDNPESGQEGEWTPVGQPFVKTDEICRAFLTTLTTKTSSSSLQGTACRPSGGEWVIKDIKPWRKPG